MEWLDLLPSTISSVAVAGVIYFGKRIIDKVDFNSGKLDDLIASNSAAHEELDGKINTLEARFEERTDAMEKQIDTIANSPFITRSHKH